MCPEAVVKKKSKFLLSVVFDRHEIILIYFEDIFQAQFLLKMLTDVILRTQIDQHPFKSLKFFVVLSL